MKVVYHALKLLLLPLLLLCSVLLSNEAHAQGPVQVSIADDTVSTCNGTLFDTGGQGGNGYSDNETFVLTICPDNPNDVITLDWVLFNLSTTNTAPQGQNNADNITIYDGNSTAATSLGTYTGTQLQGLLVTGTSLNTTGCLTLEWTSNDQGTGNFAATITCATPCQRPTVVMNAPSVNQNPQRICDGETVNFDGSGSFAANGFNIVDYIWDWGDGTIDTLATATTSHTFNQGAGEYLVNLIIIDDNNCISTNLETIQVLVATTPSFTGTTNDSAMCIGETICLDGVVTPTTWTGLPVSSLGGATYLPDNVGQCFTATLDFEAFLPGQTLNNINDLQSVCVSMEHSFMGDLVATIYCPNGQSVITHQQGGGGTYIGDPIDVDDPLQPGNCWQYCWSPTATNGTWVDNSNQGATPNLVPTTLQPGGMALAPGTYESLNPMNALVGCPLNGTWTIEFCDLWGADDGFVCDWSVNFDPSLFPPLTTFTPEFGNQCDSTAWAPLSPNAAGTVASQSGDCNQICVNPSTPGVYDYQYTAVDNFGCTFDTVISVTVDNTFTVNAGNDTTICIGNDAQLNGTVTGGITTAPGCDYILNMFDNFGDGWNGFQVEIFIDGVSIGTFTLNAGSVGAQTFYVPDGSTISINTTSGAFDTEVSYDITDPNGAIVWQNGPGPIIGNNVWTGVASCPNAGSQYTYQWSPATGLNDPALEDPISLAVGQDITYVLTAWETGHQACALSDTMNITVLQNVNAGLDSMVAVCWDADSVDLWGYIGGTPDPGGSWLTPTLAITNNFFDPMTEPAGNYAYIVGGGAGCPPDTAFIAVGIIPQGDPACGCPLAPTIAFTDATCADTCNGTITITDPFGAEYSIDGGLNWQPANQFNAVCAGTYNQIWVRDGALICIDSSLTATVNEPLPLDIVITTTDVVCNGGCDGIANAVVNGGTAPYNYNWNGLAGPTDPDANNICAGTHPLNITDANGCVLDTSFVITEPGAVTIDNVAVIDETCYQDCDGAITITGTNIDQYSIDDGVTFQATGTFTGLCPGWYFLAAVDTNGCVVNDSVIVGAADQVIADFIATPQPTTISNTDITFLNQSTNAATYVWDIAGLESYTTENAAYSFLAIPETYNVCLAVADSNNCVDTVCQDIIIQDELILYAPNAFTPNGDGINDYWFPVVNGFDATEFELLIFDRWGELIFEASDPNTQWDGTYMGMEAPVDVYVWYIKVKPDNNNGPEEFRGHVTLIR